VINRWASGASALAGFLGAAGLAIAVSGSAASTYVSESGVPGALRAGLYSASMVLLAISLALLAGPAARACRLIGASLALAAPLAALSGAVHCSPGCPLPPYETPTPRDLIHAAAAIGALLLCALAILLYCLLPPPWRGTGRLGVAIAYPPLLLSAAGILFAGRSLFTGVMERAALIGVSAWVIVTALQNARLSSAPENTRPTTDPENTRRTTDPGNAQPTDPGNARPTDPGNARPTDLGNAQPTDPGNAQPTDLGNARPTAASRNARARDAPP
jgi:hypothetical protein